MIYCTHCTRAPWKLAADSTTTSAQLRHIRKYHPSLPTTYEGEAIKLQELQSESPTSNIALPFIVAATQPHRAQPLQFQNKVFREHLAAFIVSSNSSLSLVENPNFHRMLEYCNSKVQPISRHTLGRDIQALYDVLFQQLCDRL